MKWLIFIIAALALTGCGANDSYDTEPEPTGGEYETCLNLDRGDKACSFDFDGQRCIVFKGYRRGGLDCRDAVSEG